MGRVNGICALEKAATGSDGCEHGAGEEDERIVQYPLMPALVRERTVYVF
jgi:hypothetical protein